MTDWRDLEALTDRMVLGACCERVKHQPYSQTPNGRSQPDESRPERELSAVVYAPEEKAVATAAPRQSAKAEAITARITVNRRDYPDLVIRRGDAIELLDRQGQIMTVGKVTGHYTGIIVAEVSP